MEKCWQIKESLPIHASKAKNRRGEWDILIPKMTMTYDTFMRMDTSVTHMETYGTSYDYEDGSITLSVTERGLSELEKMTDLITIK